MLRSDFLPLPVHASGALVIDLHAIHAYVSLSGCRIARHYARQCDESPPVLRPALQNREMVQAEVVFANDFLAWTCRDCLWEELAHLGKHGQHFHFVEEALR